MESKKTSFWLNDLPNKLTYSRIAAIPLLLVIYPWNVGFLNIVSSCIFGIAALTDFFDGYLARRFNTSTKIGAILDPIADKLLITAAIILLTNAQIMPAWMAGLFLCREAAVSGLRIIAAEKNRSFNVSSLAKWKTAFQGVAIFILMTSLPQYHTFGMIVAWLALLTSYVSAYVYWDAFWKAESKLSI